MKHSYSRKTFLQQMAALSSVLLLPDLSVAPYKPKLSFSTLGCPEWDFQKIISFAAAKGYQGIELRGILKQMDLTRCEEFNSLANRRASLQKMEDNGLHFVNLGSSATLHFPEGNERDKNIEEGKRFIQLAHDLKCPFIRVFPNNFIKDQTKQQTLDLIAKGLIDLAAFAKGSGVSILMETHGDMVREEDIVQLMQSCEHPQIGLVWDFTNMWTITRVSPAQVYPLIRKWIRHTHVKDASLAGDKIQYKFLGKGEVPVKEALLALQQDGYKGYYSFEWEKTWHPELDEPELALADYPLAIKSQFK